MVSYLTKEEMRKIENIHQSNFELKIDPYNLKYTKPKYLEQDCLSNNKTYNINLYLPTTIKFKNKFLIKCDKQQQKYANT